MEASRNHNGIQLLLSAEQETQRIVDASKTGKQARLKQAKDEAEKEILEFRAQMETEYQRKLAESSGDSGANVKRLEHETDGKIQHLKTESGRIARDVGQMLLRNEKLRNHQVFVPPVSNQPRLQHCEAADDTICWLAS